MENPFEFHEEDTIIACVGDNGGTTDEDIRNGFKRTVELLTESLKTGSEVEDLLVYPIVYNARHSIELSLKIVIKMLWRIEEKKGICYSEEVLKERKKELHTHSIECLYKLACDKKNIDRRIPAYFENAHEHLEELKPNRARESMREHYDMAQMSKALPVSLSFSIVSAPQYPIPERRPPMSWNTVSSTCPL